MEPVKLLCARCGAALAPTMSGRQCPRLSACGFGGFVETLDFQPNPAWFRRPTDASA